MQPNPSLLHSLRSNLRIRHFSRRTEQAYVYWTKRFVRHFGLRHPRELGGDHVRQLLVHLAVERRVAASTQLQAQAALIFLYRHVVGTPLEGLGPMPTARRPTTLPVVLTQTEVANVIGRLEGTKRFVSSLLYGSGLRLMECLTLRV